MYADLKAFLKPEGILRAAAVAVALLWPVARAGAAPSTDHTTYIVTLPGADYGTILRTEDAGGVIDHFDGGDVRAYVHHSRWRDFLSAGIPHRILAMQPDADKQLDGYPSYVELGETLAAAAEAHPGITRLISLGQSVLGRELWAWKRTSPSSPIFRRCTVMKRWARCSA